MAIPHLENSWDNFSMGILYQQRLEELIQEIQFEETQKLLKEWIVSEDKDLLKGIYLVAKFHYPNLNFQDLELQVNALADHLWLELNDRQTSFEKIKIFNRVFFEHLGFTPDQKNPLSPFNFYINDVLDSRKGNVFSLSILYSILAQKLHVPIYGINLPNHFILAYLDKNGIMSELDPRNNSGVLCYINAFDKGKLIYHRDIKEYLNICQVADHKSYYEPSAHTQIIKRLIQSLIFSYQSIGKQNKVYDLISLKNLFAS